MIYKLCQESIKQKKYRNLTNTVLCYYPCINHIRSKGLVPNEDLMGMITQFNLINIKDFIYPERKEGEEVRHGQRGQHHCRYCTGRQRGRQRTRRKQSGCTASEHFPKKKPSESPWSAHAVRAAPPKNSAAGSSNRCKERTPLSYRDSRRGSTATAMKQPSNTGFRPSP